MTVIAQTKTTILVDEHHSQSSIQVFLTRYGSKLWEIFFVFAILLILILPYSFIYIENILEKKISFFGDKSDKVVGFIELLTFSTLRLHQQLYRFFVILLQKKNQNNNGDTASIQHI